MRPADYFLYEYSIVRYVPRLERGEFVNIGLIMMCKRQKWLRGEIWLDRNRLMSLDPDVNFENLKRQASLFTNTDIPDPCLPIEEKYRWLSAEKSAVLQTSPSHAGIASSEDEENTDSKEILEKEFHRLFEVLVK